MITIFTETQDTLNKCYEEIKKQNIIIILNALINIKNDIKNTWTTISGIICKSKPNTYPYFFIENGRKLYDKKIIANKFNSYFTDTGPNQLISTTSDKELTSFLKNKPTSKLCFEEVNESTMSKIIDELPSKSSFGYDNIITQNNKIFEKFNIITTYHYH